MISKSKLCSLPTPKVAWSHSLTMTTEWRTTLWICLWHVMRQEGSSTSRKRISGQRSASLETENLLSRSKFHNSNEWLSVSIFFMYFAICRLIFDKYYHNRNRFIVENVHRTAPPSKTKMSLFMIFVIRRRYFLWSRHCKDAFICLQLQTQQERIWKKKFQIHLGENWINFILRFCAFPIRDAFPHQQ